MKYVHATKSGSPAKNCHNCKYGYPESDGEHGEHWYFVCENREDDGYNNLENKLSSESYLNKSKVCCEFSDAGCLVYTKCVECGGEDVCHESEVDKFQCFDCFVEKTALPLS